MKAESLLVANTHAIAESLKIRCCGGGGGGGLRFI